MRVKPDWFGKVDRDRVLGRRLADPLAEQEGYLFHVKPLNPNLRFQIIRFEIERRCTPRPRAGGGAFGILFL